MSWRGRYPHRNDPGPSPADEFFPPEDETPTQEFKVKFVQPDEDLPDWVLKFLETTGRVVATVVVAALAGAVVLACLGGIKWMVTTIF